MAQASLQHSPEYPIKELRDSAAHSSSHVDTEDIPTVDFDLLVNETAHQRLRAVQDLGRACEDWGFFMVINHGVPESLREGMMDACKDLFDLTSEEKAEYIGAAPVDPIRIGTGFYSAVDDARYSRDYVKMFAHPEFHCPAKPPKLSDIAKEYSVRARALAMELVKAISESLGLESGRISEALDLDACFQILVGNLYPPCPRPGLATGMPAHSDHGLLTLLFQNGVAGLQVKHNDHWVPVKPHPNSFLVITGDQLEIVSNGRYRSVLHRAVVGAERTRMSFVSLIGPCLDAIVEPIPELAGDGHRLEFRCIKYRDFMEHQQSNKLNEKSALDLVRVHDQ